MTPISEAALERIERIGFLRSRGWKRVKLGPDGVQDWVNKNCSEAKKLFEYSTGAIRREKDKKKLEERLSRYADKDYAWFWVDKHGNLFKNIDEAYRIQMMRERNADFRE